MATMAELITQVRRRTDTENSTFVTDAEIEDFVNDSIADLHAELMVRWGSEFLIVSPTLAIAAGANGNLASIVPSPFTEPPLKVLEVALIEVSGTTVRHRQLQPYNLNDTVLHTTETRDWTMQLPRFKLFGATQLLFEFPSTTAQTVKITAVPSPTRYDRAVATQIRELYAWREYVIVDAAIKVLAKEESDVAGLEARKMTLLSRISATAPPRTVPSKIMVDGRADQEFAWETFWE